MTLTEPAPTDTSSTEAEALFKEARRRRHRRWAVGIVLVVALSVVLGVLLLSGPGTPPSRSAPHLGLPKWTAPPGSSRPVPTVYVAGDGKGGVGVYSTATGSLVRTLSSQSPGGPDGQVVLSADRQSVFFAQPTGSCTGDILRGPISGVSAPAVVLSVPPLAALSPSPSPRANDLAWIGVTCGSSGAAGTSTLYVTNLTTDARSDLGVLSGGSSDDEIAWSPDGRRLAVENANSVTIFVRQGATFTKSNALRSPLNCRLGSPVFLLQRYEVAVISTCYGGSRAHTASKVLAFDTSTGKPAAVIAAASAGAVFQGLSVDASGQRILVGLVATSSAGATLVQVDGGRHPVTVSRNAVTDAEW